MNMIYYMSNLWDLNPLHANMLCTRSIQTPYHTLSLSSVVVITNLIDVPTLVVASDYRVDHV
jgi:hypothetical protein